MKVLLDECVDWRLARDIIGHDVKTAHQMGWATIKNGELLALAGGQFEVFVTLDRNLSFQQNLVTYSIAVIVLRAKSNRLVDLKPLIPKLVAAIESARTGVVAYIDADQAVSSSARKVPHAAASPFISDVRDDRIIGFRGDSACGYSAAGECTMVGGAGGPL